MPSEDLLDALSEEIGSLPDSITSESLDRVLTEPAQQSLAEAVAADVVDAAPVVGDLLVLVRMQNAQEQDIEYPDRPTVIENALSDLPPPLATIGDIIVAQNVLSYLERNQNVPVSALPDEITEETATDVDDFIEQALPGVGDD